MVTDPHSGGTVNVKRVDFNFTDEEVSLVAVSCVSGTDPFSLKEHGSPRDE